MALKRGDDGDDLGCPAGVARSFVAQGIGRALGLGQVGPVDWWGYCVCVVWTPTSSTFACRCLGPDRFQSIAIFPRGVVFSVAVVVDVVVCGTLYVLLCVVRPGGVLCGGRSISVVFFRFSSISRVAATPPKTFQHIWKTSMIWPIGATF